ncbi:DUF1097 domain-containing protein [Bradyrhizobium sp. Arg68]|uniref:DUF1097 domain-containing protein n=1 Tax=Bradyrhizobium ivorense TaxID=2511166 RepID=UPI001E564CCA|nr:DUF1097 domain-containing protein [Bradyrhizobium ivorense]MCC8938522.1 DUF1097 domain-containing protein [Bradyrhizobium ivorense]
MTVAASQTRSLRFEFHSVTFIVAVVAAVATLATSMLSLPAWAMFLGWVGYSVSGQTRREGFANLISLLLGLALGLGAGLLIAISTPLLGVLAIPAVIFGVVVLVMSLRGLPLINNPLAYFAGLIIFFASAAAPSVGLFIELASASALGAVGAAFAGLIQSWCRPVPKAP